MICEKLKLYDKKVYEGCENVVLETYIRASSKELPIPPRPAMLVFGGGGYAYVSDREVEPIVMLYLAAGFNVCALRYSVMEAAAGGKPILDAALALATIRKNADEWNIDPDKIAVCGFSAGGHLAASIGTCWHEQYLYDVLGIPENSAKVNAMILGYPVITATSYGHLGSFYNLTGKSELSAEDIEKYSCEKHVDENTAPAFIWHTAFDSCVPVQNSLIFALALSDKKIPYELHVLPFGEHGLSRANFETSPNPTYNLPYVERWGEWSVQWLKKVLKWNPEEIQA